EEGAPAAAVGPAAVNRLAARMSGLDLALRINGQPVYELVVDTPPPSARYGLVAVARGQRVVATFSNLTLRGL
ncbi:MAG TPA: hypothetical protein PKD53_17955, partial [Chloroflexaceae bacterium]|nr:hypothetical protein [Chloroflexaceae bacterium]